MHINPLAIFEFIVGIFLWWMAVYLIAQNPFNRLTQLLSAILGSISLYLTSDLFFYIVIANKQTHILSNLLRAFTWTIYLPAPLFYHTSLLLTSPNLRLKWQKYFLPIAYIMGGLIIVLESATSLTRDYEFMNSPDFNGKLNTAIGPYFWVLGIGLLLIMALTAVNFFILYKNALRHSTLRQRYFWPFLGTLSSIISGPLIILAYYQIIPESLFLASFTMIALALPLAYSIIKYDLLIEEAKIVFGRTFLYSTLVITLILGLYTVILVLTQQSFNKMSSLILPYALTYLIITTHPAYNWLTTFVRDLVFNLKSGLSVVNDEEVYQALRNYQSPNNLEDSPLLRLKQIDIKQKQGHTLTPIDALRNTIKEAIDYFKPQEDINHRTKRNLKYHLLKMLAFNEAEEGQILWELGFEEYPLRIMQKESSTRAPLFKIHSPSDYSYISRNAYIALKKEAIHDITWRISYLEKHVRKT